MNACCNNCTTSGFRILYPAGRAQKHQIVQCVQCGLMYAFPLEQDNLIGYSVATSASSTLNESSPEVQRALNKLPDFETIEESLTGLLPSKGYVVEVGAYSGVLLKLFNARGWKTMGIEPDGRAVEFACREYKLDVRNGTLLSLPLDPATADAVVMLHVIEHLDNPAKNVQTVSRLLRKDGIFVVETPVYDSLTYRILGRRERNLSCDGHIFFYTEDTLSQLLRASGFTIIKVERVGRTLSVSRLLWNIGVISKNDFVRRILSAFSERFELGRRFVHVNARDIIRIYAKKTNVDTV